MSTYYSAAKPASTINKIRVMIVEDHELVRTGINICSTTRLRRCGCRSHNGEDAIEISRSQTIDVVLMDVKMPGIGGLEATRRLLRIHPDIKILVVTVCDDSLFPSKLAGRCIWVFNQRCIHERNGSCHQDSLQWSTLY